MTTTVLPGHTVARVLRGELEPGTPAHELWIAFDKARAATHQIDTQAAELEDRLRALGRKVAAARRVRVGHPQHATLQQEAARAAEEAAGLSVELGELQERQRDAYSLRERRESALLAAVFAGA